MKSLKVLFIATSHDKMGDTGGKTGLWLEELAAPYYLFREAGAEVELASPLGGRVPLDPKSQSIIVATQRTKSFLKDAEAMNFLSHSILLEEIKAAAFDIVFLPGGHGAMWDLADNNILTQLLEAFNKGNKPIASVSHGIVGLLSLKNDTGEMLVKGKQLTCFSNSEEELAGLTGIVPFLAETKLVSLGGLYSKGESYVSHVVADGNIITGQNAASSTETAKKIIVWIQQNKQTPVTLQPSLIKQDVNNGSQVHAISAEFKNV